MNDKLTLKEIVNRPDTQAVEQDEALFVIKEYVKARKGVDVNPHIETGHGNMYAIQQIQMMVSMLPHAIGWFRNEWNKDK